MVKLYAAVAVAINRETNPEKANVGIVPFGVLAANVKEAEQYTLDAGLVLMPIDKGWVEHQAKVGEIADMMVRAAAEELRGPIT